MTTALPQPKVLGFIPALAICLAVAAAGCGGGAQMRKIDDGGTGGTTPTDVPVTHRDAGVDQPVSPPVMLEKGAACTAATGCKSGFCVDGVCCESACTGACLYCAAPDTKGSCVPADLGTNPRNGCLDTGKATCGTDGYCDGAGACEKYPAGVACQTAGCTGSTLTFLGRCDGNGTCGAPASQSCAPYICGADGQCKTTCSMDTDCGSTGTFCVSGSCGKKPIGASCGTTADCNSGFCAQGVCCATACTGTCKSCAVQGSAGTCINVPAGQDPLVQCDDQGAATCLQDGFCDGKGACENYAAGTSCGASTCTGGTVTPAGKCDGAGTCTPGAPQSCSAYACGTGACKTSCAADNDCGSGYFCVGGTCTKKTAGAVCTTDSDCGTGHCAQGVCCKTACAGACMSCALANTAGTCTPIAAGMDPYNQCADQSATNPCGTSGACDGNGACAFFPAGTSCGAASCTGATLTQARSCDGAGVCQAAKTAKCDPFMCGTAACNITCTTSADCVAPNVCTGGSCGKLPPGAACTAASSCVSGFCAQGVCCDTACTGTCLSCALPGSAGTCSPVPAGKAPTPAAQCAATTATGCSTDGLCDGAGHCRDWPSGTQCAPASCTGAVLTPAATCDGAGVCKTVTPVNCAGNLTCGSATGCKTTCTADADCVTPTVCTAGSCSLKPNGTICSAATECASSLCQQGVCCASTCTGTCMSCAVAGSAGTCKPVPASQAPAVATQCATAAASTCGTDGLCDGTGKCQLYGATTVCGAATCVGDVATPARTCDGAGNCKTVTSTLCDPWGCGTKGVCNTTCAANSDCTAPAMCAAGSCGKLAIGQTCATPNACQSGFCVNAVCCNNACTGTCTTCTLAGSVGTCTAVPANQAPMVATQCTDSGASTCGTNGKCDGNGACQKYASGTVCVGASCTGSTLTPAATCNSAGTCVKVNNSQCNPYICGTNACKTTCTANTDCVTPDICAGGSCVPPVTLTVQLAERDTFTTDAAVAPHFAIKNSGTNPVALSSITLRYWYTEEGTSAQTASCDYAMISCANITMSLVPVSPAVTGANTYFQVGFTTAAGTLAPGASTTDIQLRFSKNDFTNYSETDDYSYLATTAYTTTTKVTGYLNGTLIYGSEPK